MTGATGAGVLTRARPAAVARGRNSALARWTIVADCTFTPNDFRVDFQPSGGPIVMGLLAHGSAGG